MTPSSDPSGFRLSPQQSRVWSLLAGAPGPRSGCVLQIRGDVDRGRIERALAEVVSRHEILRTTYRTVAGAVVVQIPHADPVLSWIDEPASGDADSRLATVVDRLRTDRADPCAGVVCAWTEIGPDHHALRISASPLSLDGRSLAALARHLARALEGTSEAALQYADLSELFNDLLESPETEAGRRQWRDVDPRAGVEPTPPARGFRSRVVQVPVPPGFADTLTRAAAALEVEPWVVVLAGWQALQVRCGDPSEGTVGLGLAGRNFDGMDDALGLFERRVPLGPTGGPADGLGGWIRNLRSELARVIEWQDYCPIDTAGGGRFRIVFSSIELPAPSDGGGVGIEPLAVESPVDGFDLELVFTRRRGALDLYLRADAVRWGARDQARVAERLVVLLEAAVSDLDTPVARLPVVGPAELAELHELVGRTDRPCDVDACIHERFEAQAARTPDRPAVVFDSHQLTYRELSRASDALADHLIALGLPPESRVGLLLERSVWQLVGVLGVLKAGGAYVPLDPMLPAQRIVDVSSQADVRVIVTQRSLESVVPESLGCTRVRIEEIEPSESDRRHGAPAVSPTALAYVLFTSGSTGRPKGVMIQHRSVLHLLLALRESVYGRLEADRPDGLRVSMSAPLAFDASVKQWVQLLAGHTVHIVPEEARPDPARLAQWVRSSRVDVLDCTPVQVAGLLEHRVGLDPADGPASVLVGGEAIDEASWAAMARAEPGRFVNVYGPTECTVDATCVPVRSSPRPTLGPALANVRLQVLEPHLDPSPIGVTGEIWIGGVGVGRGYCASPGLTAERFLPDPSGPPGARMYRTGDLGRMHSTGWVDFLGRSDGQVKVRGIRIELGEIEATLKRHPSVHQAAVVVTRDRGSEHLVGWVVLREARDAGAHLTELRASLRTTLPEYMVPGRLFVREALPLTPNGKVDRRMLADAVPQGQEVESYEPPASETERRIAAIWEEVLGVEKVGREQNFFDLGGHSMLAVKLHDRLGNAFTRKLSLVDVFRHPTVAALARFVGGAEAPLASLDERANQQRQARERQAQRHRSTRG